MSRLKINDNVQMVQTFLAIYKQTHDSYWSQYFLLSYKIMQIKISFYTILTQFMLNVISVALT